jgi:hypothetical protein
MKILLFCFQEDHLSIFGARWLYSQQLPLGFVLIIFSQGMLTRAGGTVALGRPIAKLQKQTTHNQKMKKHSIQMWFSRRQL